MKIAVVEKGRMRKNGEGNVHQRGQKGEKSTSQEESVVIGKFFFFQAEDGIRDVERSRGVGDVYKGKGLQMLDIICNR